MRTRHAALLVLPLALAACTRAVPVRGTTEAAADTTADTAADAVQPQFAFLDVDNHNWSDVVVYLNHNGHVTRLATVSAASKLALRIPGTFLAASTPLQLVAHPIGGRGDFRSERFTVQPGQQVTWTLESELARSSLAIY